MLHLYYKSDGKNFRIPVLNKTNLFGNLGNIKPFNGNDNQMKAESLP